MAALDRALLQGLGLAEINEGFRRAIKTSRRASVYAQNNTLEAK